MKRRRQSLIFDSFRITRAIHWRISIFRLLIFFSAFLLLNCIADEDEVNGLWFAWIAPEEGVSPEVRWEALLSAATNEARVIGAPMKSRRDVHRISGVIPQGCSPAECQPLVKRRRYKRCDGDDPELKYQWHLEALDVPTSDLRRGEGVLVSIVDDGVQYLNSDLGEARYAAEFSYDWNSDEANAAPKSSSDSHGTSCAGLVAAGAEDCTCGQGVAPYSRYASQRLIASPADDLTEADALGYHADEIDIYTCSWGPEDSGSVKEAPGPLTKEALRVGTRNGRKGRGCIYVWAAGNGRANGDNANYDGYANSIYTLTIGAVDRNGRQAIYSEPGSPLLVVAPSSPPGIVTTASTVGGYYFTKECRSDFGGTSAAAPMVAGVVALMIQARPELGWRDVIGVLMETAKKTDELDPGWIKNGAGRWIHHKYGYGLVSAASALEKSRTRSLLPPFAEPLNSTVVYWPSEPLEDGDGPAFQVPIRFQTDGTWRVEQIELTVRISHERRGDFLIMLTSPMHTTSILATPNHDSNANWNLWTFTSIRHWGEGANGLWIVRICDMRKNQMRGMLHFVQLTLHGTNQI